MAVLSSFARFINPGFAFFDKPWLFALLVFNLTLAGGITLFAIFANSCKVVCDMDQKCMATLTHVNMFFDLWGDFVKPPCDEVECAFESFQADFCIMSGRRLAYNVNNKEIYDDICMLPDNEILRHYFPAKDEVLEKARHPIVGTGGKVVTSALQWCEGEHWERERKFYEEMNPPSCGNSVADDYEMDEKTGRQIGGTWVPWMVHYCYHTKTCKKTCPTTLEAISDANANLKYVELVMTLIVALILIPTGCVRAKSPIYKQDASISSVLRSADGMMVPPRAPHPPPRALSLHVARAWCRSTCSR